MTRVDQFESVFRSATCTIFQPVQVKIDSVLFISDADGSAAEEFTARSHSFLAVLDERENLRWVTVPGSEFRTVSDLLERVDTERPGLTCTHRHLHSESWRWPYTLGEYVDVLIQATTTPVLVIPHPEQPDFQELAGRRPRSVMAMTDHLTGDHRLVNYAAYFTQLGGHLLLGHKEKIELWTGCIAGALLEAELSATVVAAGFTAFEITWRAPVFEGAPQQSSAAQFGTNGINYRAPKAGS
jgi:hypothetical protein